MRVDPGQTLRMGQNRHIASYDQIEKRVDQSCRVNMMRGFDENVAATGKSQKPSVPSPATKSGTRCTSAPLTRFRGTPSRRRIC